MNTFKEATDVGLWITSSSITEFFIIRHKSVSHSSDTCCRQALISIFRIASIVFSVLIVASAVAGKDEDNDDIDEDSDCRNVVPHRTYCFSMFLGAHLLRNINY